jgi:SseB protein N-terminal domain
MYKTEKIFNFISSDLNSEASLDLLANLYLFTPVVMAYEVAENFQTEKYRILSFNKQKRKIVPTFTSQKLLSEWGNGKFSSLTVQGIDLAQCLPGNVWLHINPGSQQIILLSPNEILKIKSLPIRKLTNVNYLDTALQISESDFLEDKESKDALKTFVNRKMLLSELKNSLSRYPLIQRAYFVDSSSPEGDGGVLGIFVSTLSQEERYELAQAVATISKTYFGYAGAIEVYDNLLDSKPNSREMFDSFVPFYFSEEIGFDDLFSEKIKPAA